MTGKGKGLCKVYEAQHGMIVSRQWVKYFSIAGALPMVV